MKDVKIKKTIETRERSYGSFKDMANLAQNLKREAFSSKRIAGLGSDKKEALELILTKIARILNGDPNHLDSWLDIAGYAMLVVEILKTKKTKGTS